VQTGSWVKEKMSRDRVTTGQTGRRWRRVGAVNRVQVCVHFPLRRGKKKKRRSVSISLKTHSIFIGYLVVATGGGKKRRVIRGNFEHYVG